jgi:uncharacterized protein YegL
MGEAAVVILADCSGSMTGEPIRQLREKLGRIWPSLHGARLFAFESVAAEVESPDRLPDHPGGSTALHLALERAAELHPGEVIVISDGAPDDAEAALAAARKLPGTVQAIFVGDEVRNREAVEFMTRLARENGGRVITRRLSDPAFEVTMRRLMGLPSPVSC